jgi:HPt (histidine-containing phosphotransfer) domain-containing protein
MTRIPEEKVAATRARMGELALKFTERTRGEIDLIRARLASLGAGDTAALGEIRHLAHRICGTGATLGFEGLAELAHEIEKLAAASLPAGQPDNAILARLEGAVDALAGELRRSEPGGG